MAEKRWTLECDEFVIRNYGMMKQKDMAKVLGFAPITVNEHVRYLREEGRLEEYSKRPWSQEDKDYVLQYYKVDGSDSLSTVLDRTPSAVRNQYRYLRRKMAK